MNIEGLDYNTQREKLVMPEYGREIQSMVDYAVTLENKEDRQRCAETIISIMERMFPENIEAEDGNRKLWDHLALMSGFKLDIDYPYDVTLANKITQKPEPLPYPMQKIPVRHYGSMIFKLFEQLKTMEPGEERDALMRLTANQMHRSLLQWSHGSSDEEKVADDLARYTDGKIQLDLGEFQFDRMTDYNKNKKRK